MTTKDIIFMTLWLLSWAGLAGYLWHVYAINYKSYVSTLYMLCALVVTMIMLTVPVYGICMYFKYRNQSYKLNDTDT